MRSYLRRMSAAVTRRMRAWIRRRQGPDAGTVVLRRGRIYILPTQLGLAYAVMVFAMLVGGLNYNNNLGLALTFSPPIYDYYETLPDRLWGIGAAKDQNLGGFLMSTEQALVFFTAIVWLLVRLFREEAEAEARLAAEQRAAGLREH